MYPNKQDKHYKQRKMQFLYRKKKRKEKVAANEHSIVWEMIISICVLVVFLLFVGSVLFDIGVPLPPFFGI